METEQSIFLDKLESFVMESAFRRKILSNFIIFCTETDDRRQMFYDVLEKTGLKKYDPQIHNLGDDFDYVVQTGEKYSPQSLYDLFFNFNRKTIIIDTDTNLKKQALIDILEGAVCSSPDSGEKWPIRLDGRKTFRFFGSVIFLTNIDKGKFFRTKKFSYLRRDMLKI